MPIAAGIEAAAVCTDRCADPAVYAAELDSGEGAGLSVAVVPSPDDFADG